MVDFFDLPRSIRDKIYRLHLVKTDGSITLQEHEKMIGNPAAIKKSMPPIMKVSKVAEKEAAPIYFGENRFDLADVDLLWSFSSSIWLRHLKLVRAITCAWVGDVHRWRGLRVYGGWGTTRESFIRLSKMKGLESLYIRVDETEMLRSMSIDRETRQRPFDSDNITPQENLAIFRFPAITGLLAITKVKDVQFLKMIDQKGEESGGPLPDGPILTQILPRLRPQVKARRKYVESTEHRLLHLDEADICQAQGKVPLS